ncbi:MAG: hypothetical protein P8P30_05560 [Rickettsiales bacterium]|nr:hypothetical protein [Rickettsiales bacterium]
MNQEEKKAAGTLLARMANILDVAEEVAEKILTEVTGATDISQIKTSTLLGDLIKLIQLLEKQYTFLRTIEKEQEATKEIPQPNEQIIRNYLNKKHGRETRAEKKLRKGKQKHV